jgi:predicted ester cyclase
MKNILCSVALLALAACGQQQPAQTATNAPPAPPASAAEPAPATTSAALAEKKPEALPPLAPADRVKWYQECWTAFNGKDWNKFGPCMAENATSEQVDSGMPLLKGRAEILEKGTKNFAAAFPDATGEHQLTLLNGNTIVSVVLVRGSNTGAMKSPMGDMPPTNKKMGVLMAHVIESTPDGRQAVAERFYMDAASQLGQLGLNPAPHRKMIEVGWPKKETALAAGNDVEKANLETHKKIVESFNKHDSAGLTALLADDIVFSDVAAPTDTVGKPAVKKSHDEMFKAFSDVTLTPDKTWAAGDYVVSEGTFAGTNTGDMPSWKLKKTNKKVSSRYLEITKYQGGKVKNHWIFDNGMAFAMQLGMMPPPGAKGAKPAPGAAAPGAKPGAAADPKGAKPAPAAAAPAAKPGATPATPATPAAPGAKPATPAAPATPPAKK